MCTCASTISMASSPSSSLRGRAYARRRRRGSAPAAGTPRHPLARDKPLGCQGEETAMTAIQPQLAHFGIYAKDVARLVDFYTRVLGLVVADRGQSQRMNAELAFLTGTPGQHHQLVLISGRAPQGTSTVNQISFKVRDLDELKAVRGRVLEAGITELRPVSHGNALSFYFADPEGNGIEVYIDTPW